MIDVTGIRQIAKSKPLPPMPTVSGLNEIQGFTRFYIGVNMKMDDFKEWSPQRIRDFFDGVAQVIHARGIPQS